MDDANENHPASELNPQVTAAPRRQASGQVIVAILIAGLSIGTAISSILGQGIAYRQMRAIEDMASRCGK